MLSQLNNSESSFSEETFTSYQNINTNFKLFENSIWFKIKNSKAITYSNGVKKPGRAIDSPSKRWGHTSLIFNEKMLIFGGRHSSKNLINIYSLDFNTMAWTKIDAIGQTPPARDSHSSLIYNNELITFGGSGNGKKLNDIWTFNIENKKWLRVNSSGEIPCPREGFSYALIRNSYLMIYGGLNENDQNISDIFLFDLRLNIWRKVNCHGQIPSLRDSQSLTQINNSCYIFGGQGDNDKLFNDLYLLDFDIEESERKFDATWKLIESKGCRPAKRTSHSAIAYESKYLFIIGGEGYPIGKFYFI